MNFPLLSKTEIKLYSSIFFTHADLNFKRQSTSNKILSYIIYNIRNNKLVIDFNKLDWISRTNDKGILIQSGFYKNHTKYIDENGILKPEHCKKIQYYYNKLLQTTEMQIIEANPKDINIDENGVPFEKDNTIQQIDKNVFELLPQHTLKDVNDAFYMSKGNCTFKYDFKDRTLYLHDSCPDVTINSLQKFKIIIKTKLNTFAEYASLHYYCNNCSTNHYINPNDVVSTKQKYICTGLNEDTGKPCGRALTQPTSQSDTVQLYTYDAQYFDKDRNPHSTLVISSLELVGSEYSVVGLSLHNNGDPYLMILDVKHIPKYELDIKKYDQSIKELKDNSFNGVYQNNIMSNIEQYDNCEHIISLFDKEIKLLSGDVILGMRDIKFAMICQKFADYFNFPKICNIALVGEADVGKTYIINHYGHFLYNGGYKLSAGNSISIPALRGSARSNIDIKKGNKNRMGLLGISKCLCIDEIKENKQDLFNDLKPFLLDETFSNNTADGDKISYKKTAHIVITENPFQIHLKDYYKKVKQFYEELTMSAETQQPWDITWDLYLHVHEYNANVYLQRSIINIRGYFFDKGQHWIDGEQIATHDRFPFYFYIKLGTGDCIKTRGDAGIFSIIDKKREVELSYKLLTDNINEIFDLFKPYVAQKPNNENIAQAIKVVDESIREMNIKDKTRLRKFCAIILEVSRCMNKRKAYTWIDYMRVRRYLWSLDRGISIDEMEKYWFIPKQTTTIETFSDALPQGDSFDIDENDI